MEIKLNNKSKFYASDACIEISIYLLAIHDIIFIT